MKKLVSMSGDSQAAWLPSFGRSRQAIGVFGLLLAVMLVAGCAAPAAAPALPETQLPATAVPQAPAATVAQPATIAGAMVALAKNDKLGTFLADAQGSTLYLFEKDGKDTSNCYDQCEANWPPLFTTGASGAGDGVTATLLGTTTRKDGKTQVTYNGHPLYYFGKDQNPGDVNGQEVGNVWYVVSASGDKIETPEAAVTPAAQGGTQANAVEVSIKNLSFGAPLTVPVGTKVVWTNNDAMQHTVTEANGLFDSGNVGAGDSFSFTFTKEGTYNYACKIHSSMQGQVIVTK